MAISSTTLGYFSHFKIARGRSGLKNPVTGQGGTSRGFSIVLDSLFLINPTSDLPWLGGSPGLSVSRALSILKHLDI